MNSNFGTIFELVLGLGQEYLECLDIFANENRHVSIDRYHMRLWELTFEECLSLSNEERVEETSSFNLIKARDEISQSFDK